MLNLGLSEEQEFLRRSAREFLEKECPSSLVREMERDDRGYPPALWEQVADLGWLGLPFPEQYGGAGGRLEDLAIIVEELGRSLAPIPFQSTVVQAGLAVLALGSDEQKERIIPAIVQGRMIATVGHLEPQKSYDPRSITLSAAPQGDGFILNGTKTMVDWAHVADEVLVLARTGDAGPDGTGGLTVFLVPGKADGVTITAMPTIAEGKTFAVELRNVTVDKDRVLGPVGEAWSRWQPARQRAIIAKCSEMVGMGEAAQQMTLDYAKKRIAFGRPIGAFQAIQHKLVDMQNALDSARLTAAFAAWRLEEGLPADYWVSIAKGQASASIGLITFEGLEVHAGIGFFREYDLQLYYRKGKVAEIEFGDTRFHEQVIADLLDRDSAAGRV